MPAVGQQLFDTTGRLLGQPLEDVFQVRVDGGEPLAGWDICHFSLRAPGCKFWLSGNVTEPHHIGVAVKCKSMLLLGIVFSFSPTILAQKTYFMCVGPTGNTFYRLNGCPSSGSGQAMVVGPNGIGSGTVVGPVQQQQLDADQACALARQKWERSLNLAQASGRPLPSDFAARLQQNVAQMCRY